VNEEELGHGRVMKLSTKVMQKASWWPGSRLRILTASEDVLLENLGSGDYVRFYPGQPDPADAAHFTICYQFNDKLGVIDGRLNADDTITLSRKESATK
jgi:hypothetical protein